MKYLKLPRLIGAGILAAVMLAALAAPAKAREFDPAMFETAAEKYDIPACWLAAIAALESGWGTSELAREKNNLFGWTCWDGSYMAFESAEESIRHVARAISRRPHGSIEEIAGWYNPGYREEWTERVKGILEGMED